MAFQTSVEQAMYGRPFQRLFDAHEHQADMEKIRLAAKRALQIQSRNKIQPASRRPDLLRNTFRDQLRGGDVLRQDEAEELFYYPKTVAFSKTATTGGQPLSTQSPSVLSPMPIQSRLESKPVDVEKPPMQTASAQEPVAEVAVRVVEPKKKKNKKKKEGKGLEELRDSLVVRNPKFHSEEKVILPKRMIPDAPEPFEGGPLFPPKPRKYRSRKRENRGKAQPTTPRPPISDRRAHMAWLAANPEQRAAASARAANQAARDERPEKRNS